MPRLSCSVCERNDRDQIDGAIRARTSDRAIAKRFGIGRTAIKNHALAHVTGLGRDARPNAKGGRPRNAPPPVPETPIDLRDRDAVMVEFGAMYGETRALLVLAKQSGDLVRIEKAIAACCDVLDRHAKTLGLFTDGTVVNIDARTQKVVALYDSLSTEVLERLAAGEITIEGVLEGAGAAK